MPLSKKAYLRYQIIDECLSKRSMKYPSSEKLLNEIARILEQRIARETLQKDIRDMKKSADLGFHAPIKYSRSHDGYYYDDPNYSIKKFPVGFEDKESAEFVLSLLNQSGALPYLNRFNNFVERALSFSQAENQLENDLSKYIHFEKPVVVEGLQWVKPLVDAIQLRNVVQIVYKSIKKQIASSRYLHPYLLKEYDGRWYVYGYDEDSRKERIFGLDRIADLEEVPAREFRYFTGDQDQLFEHTLGVSRFVGEPKEIILEFYYPQSEYVLSKPIHDSQEIIKK